ncbi:MAG: DNA polymerase domain-containing protein [Candidatus Methanosuratincola petrocarbonis]
MGTLEGWILDAYVQGPEAVVWIKTVDGEVLRLRDRHAPFFHVLPAEGMEEDLAYRISECREVRSVSGEDLCVSIDGPVRRMLRVETWGCGVRKIAPSLRRLPGVEGVYNASLGCVQRYLFTGLGVEPTSRVEVVYEGGSIREVRRVPDEGELAPPPFSLLAFSARFSRQAGRWRVDSLRCCRCGCVAPGGGEAMASWFFDHLSSEDPDLVLVDGFDRRFLPALLEACSASGLPLRLGRCGDPYKRLQGSAAGRVFLGDVFYGFSADRWGIAGLVERSRFAFATMGQATRWLSNRAIDSRTSFEMLRRGHAIPEWDCRDGARPVGELASRDRGGVTFTPIAGALHENVAALDFDSQYPSIILRDGISYESPYGGGGRDAILPSVIEPWLRRRLELKRLRRALGAGTDGRRCCEERIGALKMILVTIYGISGCCRNRFGNPVVFEEINRRSREAMATAKGVAESMGFRLVYADVDSLFVAKPGASAGEYSALADAIRCETGLPVSVDRHFRFLAFLPLRGDRHSAALKRYFGITYGGEVVARGIEMRRGDVPAFVRRFQESLIREVFSCADRSEVFSSGLQRGARLLEHALEELRGGNVNPEDLAVRRRVAMGISSYRSRVAHLSAALQVLASGGGVEAGDEVSFIYTDADHPNPACRVRIPELFRGSYDTKHYEGMLIRAFRTVLEGIGAGSLPGVCGAQAPLSRWM